MATLDLDREMCVCNGVSMREASLCMKAHDTKDLDEVIDKCEIGDKCESCHEEGYESDGYSIAMALSLIKQKRL